MTRRISFTAIRRLGLAIIFVFTIGAIALTLIPHPGGHRVLILATDIERGDAIDSSTVTSVEVPERVVPADAITSADVLPATWTGEPATKGTILSESVMAGSALGRSLKPGQNLISVILDRTQVPPLEAGDSVVLWGFPDNCDVNTCSASLLTNQALISSVSVNDASQWGSSATARLDIIVDEAVTETVLGHAGTHTLGLALATPHDERGASIRRSQ